jgi:hypothetical protein
MRVNAFRLPLCWLELPLLDALEDCWLVAAAPLALRPLALRPLDELARLLRLPDALVLRVLPLLRLPALRLLAPLRALLALLRELALRLLPLLRVLPLLRLLPLLPLLRLDPLAFWFLVRPRDPDWRLPLPVDRFDEARLLERLEEPRPLVADIVHLLLFDSHVRRTRRERV